MTDASEAARALAARRPTITISCEVCGKLATVVAQTGRNRPRTCSRVCRNTLGTQRRRERNAASKPSATTEGGPGPMPAPLTIDSATEADAMNAVLHCGFVSLGDAWDTEDAWPDPEIRALARRVLEDWRSSGSVPCEETKRALASCCAH